MSLAQSSYPASAVTASSDPYRSTPTASPLPSPSLGASMSRWKSVFRMGGKNGTIGMGTSSRPTILTGDGQEIPPESEFEEVSSELEPPKPTRLAATRANTEPAIHQVGDRDEEKEGTERSDSVGSSYQVHLGAQTGASLHPSTPVHEIARPMSSITTETTRSSQSSGSRNGPSSNPSPIHPQPPYAASSASLYTNASTSTTPHRNGLGMGFKSRIFSAPSSSDPSSSFLSMSSSSKKDKRIASSTASSTRKKSGGSSTSSQSQVGPSPQTPHKNGAPGSPSKGSNGSGKKQSATKRFLRRVVSAPNAKALFGNQPDVPPMPQISPEKNASPTVIINPHTEASDLASPLGGGPSSQIAHSSHGGYGTAVSSSPLRQSGLSATGTRGARSLTASAALKKDAQAALGVGLESHHKQVFRRTYSSNSIKTRSVEVSASSFQKIKLLGK